MRCMIDSGFTYLAICECGWRGLPCATRLEALQEARDHEARAHWGDQDAADALWHYEQRHAAEKGYVDARRSH
jgi:hypothetical protein